ncbi:hypothetical protein KJ359_010934 [Pestalotiopsis sp. 9143b]|nr:hypothetical protein KJ359_010934 [Pestalotiopsis sp. 9143b]
MPSPTAEPKTLHLVGVGVTHSPAPPMHDHIARTLGLPWTFTNAECPTVGDAAALARSPGVAGLVVTMPYKHAIVAAADLALDERAAAIGACNNVAWDGTKLVGGNTDWAGIRGSLLEAAAAEEVSRDKSGFRAAHPPALLVGAGGASRAAVYALAVHLGCSEIYVLNRDAGEVADLAHDAQRIKPTPSITHIQFLGQARDLDTPYYIVSCVPDAAPESEAEHEVAAILQYFLSRSIKGVLLDMCYKPRRTRIIRQAQELGWTTVDGTHVIGHQMEEQWKLWVGPEKAAKLDTRVAWDILMREADASSAINF